MAVLLALVRWMTDGCKRGGASENPGSPKAIWDFTFDRDTPCGEDYAGFPFSVSASSREEAQTLARQIITNIASAEVEFYYDYGCPVATVRPALDTLRFQSSLRCSELVNEALKIGIKPLPEAGSKNPILCPDRCDLAVSTFKMVLGNAAACRNTWTQLMSNRISAMRRFERYCKEIGLQGSNTCNKGAVFERDLLALGECGHCPVQDQPQGSVLHHTSCQARTRVFLWRHALGLGWCHHRHRGYHPCCDRVLPVPSQPKTDAQSAERHFHAAACSDQASKGS
ncbi:hypothetical protein BC831DRAFT_481742 [Entophlyctis helioformis]|nr:hypothetical protein BC831DRAFT_481742 [Entophlyctis helioformis]